ncbi:MAG: TetR/AcrR family transcriptional regulator [Alphaproteobacteria bacterium]|nr:TetR/AcrR family transcriptional regulator [Alphaproteobacteria bacterium]
MKNPVGRPKILDRENLINIAYQEYWAHGITNVTLASIAKLANVSRPGIYKEFEDEDGLKSEVLKKYTYALKEHVLAQYKNSKDIRTLIYHLHSYIGFPQDRKIFKEIKNTPIFNAPKNPNGCLYEKAKIVKHLLNKKTIKEVNNFENYRKIVFTNYINRMQKYGEINKSLKPEDVYEYLAATLLMLQSLKNNGMIKEKIKIIINKALSAVLTPKYTLN